MGLRAGGGGSSALGAGGAGADGGGDGTSGAASPRMERTLDHWLLGLAAADGAFAGGLARGGGGGGAGLGAGGVDGSEMLSLVAPSTAAGCIPLAGIPIWSRSEFQWVDLDGSGMVEGENVWTCQAKRRAKP